MSDDEAFFTDLGISCDIDGCRVELTGFSRARFHAPIQEHCHGNRVYEIHYITDGYGSLSAEGREFPLGPGTVFVTGPLVQHSQVPSRERPMAEYCLYTEAIGPDCGGLGAAFRETRFWIGQDDQAIFANLAELERELAERAAGYRLAARDLLSTVIVKAIRAYRREPATVADTEPGAGIGRSRYLVIESAFLWDYATITLPGLADRLGLGTRQTDRLLSEMYGQSFDDKKAQARMSAAAMLLTHTDESVTAIAERTGFSSLEHFGNAFRKRYRVSPTAYRRSRS